MNRREFITLLGGAAVAWPLAAHAQDRERMRRVGIFMSLPADDPQSSVRSAAFLQALAQKGWTVGRNLQIDFRWATEDPDRLRKDANELAALAPEVLMINGTVRPSALANDRRRGDRIAEPFAATRQVAIG